MVRQGNFAVGERLVGCEGRHRSAMPAHIGSLGSLLLVGNQLWDLLLQIVINHSLKFRIHRLSHDVAQKSPAPLQKVAALHSRVYNLRWM